MPSLQSVCRDLKNGVIDIDTAAARFGITPKAMKTRVSKWGDRLELLGETMDLIAAGSITRDEAANRLGTGVRNVNALMDRWQVERPISERVIQRTLTEVKWEVRKKAALDYIRGNLNIDQAAEEAGVSDRQVRRWVSELLRKHFDMVWAELAPLSLAKRFRLAQEIEKAEGIEHATKKVVESITRGKKTMEEEALERVASKVRRKFPQDV